MTTTSTAKPLPPAEASAPDPWAPDPVLEGPVWQRAATRHETALADAARRKAAVFGEVQAQERRTAAEHAHGEALRRAELGALRRRMDRLQERHEKERPLLRDAALGAVGVIGPLALLVNGSRIEGPARHAAYLAAAGAALFAGREFMEHAHQRRLAQLEDEIDRCEARVSMKAVASPAPASCWLLARLLDAE